MSQNTTKVSSKIWSLKKSGVLLVSPLLAAQITALHQDCGQKEWSGVLLFREINADRENPENFKIIAEGCFPMDYGNTGYTEYDHGEISLDIFERYPQSDPEKNKKPWKLGHIHTHHSMGAFFSGTDDGELEDNANKYPYYVSLVVDFKGTYCAKVAFVAKTKKSVSYKKGKSWKHLEEDAESVVVTFDLKVSMDLPEWFKDRMKVVDKESRRGSTYSSGSRQYSSDNYTPGKTYPATTNSAVGKQTEPTNYNGSGGSSFAKSSLWEKLRDKLRFLFLSPKEAQTVNFYLCLNKAAESLGSEILLNTYIEEMLKTIPDWLAAHFKEETYNVYAEERLMKEATNLVNMVALGSPPAVRKIAAAFNKYYLDFYEDDDKDKVIPLSQKMSTQTEEAKPNKHVQQTYEGHYGEWAD